MRLVLNQRIHPFINKFGHNLKQWIEALKESPETDQIALTVSQSDLTSYAENSSVATPTDKKGQISDPGQADPADDSNQDDDDDDLKLQDVDDREVGIIYARVSSDGQTKNNADKYQLDEGSIEGQISELTGIAHDEGIALPYDPFIDKAKTGTNFEREGIRRVFQISKRKAIDYLLVEKIDRIGRSAPETLYFISKLQQECGVTLVTPKGEQDIEKVEGLMHTTLMSLMAEVQNTIRTKKATKERIRGFLEKKNWNCKSPKVPLGYNETEDGWLEVDPDEKPIVREIFEKFLECETYSKTEEHVIEEFDRESIDGHQIKTILTESTYIGRPKVPEDWLEGMSFENDLEEPELHLLRPDDDERSVSEVSFEKVQELVEEKSNTESTDEETYTIEDFIDEYGLFSVVESSIPVKLIHHCGEPLVRDGQVDLGGKYDITTHRYKCTHCDETEELSDYYRKWPIQLEAEKMELLTKLINGEDVFESSAADSASNDTTESDD